MLDDPSLHPGCKFQLFIKIAHHFIQDLFHQYEYIKLISFFSMKNINVYFMFRKVYVLAFLFFFWFWVKTCSLTDNSLLFYSSNHHIIPWWSRMNLMDLDLLHIKMTANWHGSLFHTLKFHNKNSNIQNVNI